MHRSWCFEQRWKSSWIVLEPPHSNIQILRKSSYKCHLASAGWFLPTYNRPVKRQTFLKHFWNKKHHFERPWSCKHLEAKKNDKKTRNQTKKKTPNLATVRHFFHQPASLTYTTSTWTILWLGRGARPEKRCSGQFLRCFFGLLKNPGRRTQEIGHKMGPKSHPLYRNKSFLMPTCNTTLNHWKCIS